jgi:hypothetical protein
MKDSSKSDRRRSKHVRRAGPRRSHARRLGIESMEDRVLLSGTSIDFSTFDAGIAPTVITQYSAEFPAQYSVYLDNGNGILVSDRAFEHTSVSTIGKNDGGYTSPSTTNSTPPIFGSGITDDLNLSGNSLDSTYGTGINSQTNGSSGSLGNANHVQPQNTPGKTPEVTFADQLGGDVDAGWRPIRIGAEPVSVISQSNRLGASVSEGGPIQVASLAKLPAGGAGDDASVVAKLARDEVDRDLRSARVAEDSTIALGQIEGEWARAMAMETVSAARVAGSHVDPTSDSPSGSARGADRRVPLSSTDGRERANDESYIEAADGLKAVAPSSDQAASELRATTASYQQVSGAIDVSALPTPAHRLERSSRVARGANVDGADGANLIRDVVFSEWHDGAVADSGPRNGGVSEHRKWINPGPFLAVLALERFVRVEPKEKQGARRAQTPREMPAR